MSLSWEPWSPEAFARAKKEGKPVLLNLFSSASLAGREMDSAYADPELAELASSSFVAVREDADDRPDLSIRYAPKGGSAVVLDADGFMVAGFPMTDAGRIKAALRQCAQSYVTGDKSAPTSPARPVWTGAVGAVMPVSAPDSGWTAKVLRAVLEAKPAAFPCVECLEFLLYAACEWKDQEARQGLIDRLRHFADGTFWDRKNGGASHADSEKCLGTNARLARLFFDAYSLTQEDRFRALGGEAIAFMMRELYDANMGAFMHCRPYNKRKAFYADGNAMAILALLKASAFPGGRQNLDTANQVLVFLTRMSDGARGMAHVWANRPASSVMDGAAPSMAQEGGRPAVYGLLSDNAWAMLAFTESFLMSGYRPHRELADATLKHLFQEMWEREKGGFLDRFTSRDDAGELKSPLMIPELNAVAFEAAWRLHQLKGNPNYRKWIEWGLGSLVGKGTGAACEQAPLARIADLLGRGRLDLEIVGRMGDAKTEALLAAVHRHYLPRKIISYVDPDDQDYIMAHKLQADSYPRLFGCIELKPKISAESPDKIPELLKALSEGR